MNKISGMVLAIGLLTGFTFAEEMVSKKACDALQAEVGATLIAEYVKVLDSISVNGVDTGFEPEALNLEAGWAFTNRLDAVAKIEKTRETEGGFSETRYGLVCNYLLRETDIYSTGLSFEYLRENYDGGDDADLVTMQLGLEF